MKISHIQYYPYTLRLKRPFVTSAGIITVRKGIIISMSNGIHYAYGEAAPLPELGSESFEMASEILDSIDGVLNLRNEIAETSEAIEKVLYPLSNFPALHHGIEQALLNLASLNAGCTLPQLLRLKTSRSIMINSVIGMLPPEEVLETARKHFSSGFRTFKLKAGRDDFEEDVRAVALIRDTFGRDVNIRIDVNGKWKADQAEDNMKRLKPYHPEYVEQPVMDNDLLRELDEFSGIPVAADESVRTMRDAINIIDNKIARVLILKPMMTGGILSTLKILSYAKMKGIKTVISSSFESSIGRRASVLLASLIADNTAHGLGTGDMFAGDTAPDVFQISNGTIKIQDDGVFHNIHFLPL